MLVRPSRVPCNCATPRQRTDVRCASVDRYTVTSSLCKGNETTLGECYLFNEPDRCGPQEHISLECTDDDGRCTIAPGLFQCLDNSNCLPHSLICE